MSTFPRLERASCQHFFAKWFDICTVRKGFREGNAVGAARVKWLVTGGMGFIGSNFIRHMLEAHSDVSIINLDRLSYGSNPVSYAFFLKS